MKQKKNFQWNIKIPHNVVVKKQADQLLIIGPLGTSKASFNRIDPNGDFAMKFNGNTDLPSLAANTVSNLVLKHEVSPSLSFCSSSKSLFRSFSSLLANKIYGVTRGYLVYLRISGIGYRCLLEQAKPTSSRSFICSRNGADQSHSSIATSSTARQNLRLKIGFSHDLLFQIPNSVRLFLIEPTLLCLYGVDKNQVTQLAAKIRAIQPPSVYKGKGISFVEETIKIKQGKRK